MTNVTDSASRLPPLPADPVVPPPVPLLAPPLPPIPEPSSALPPPLPPLPPPGIGNQFHQAVQRLEQASGIGRNGFFALVIVCLATAILPLLGGLSYLHGLNHSPETTTEQSLAMQTTLLHFKSGYPSLHLPPTYLAADVLAMGAVVLISVFPILLLVVYWTHIPRLPWATARWLGLGPAVVLIFGAAQLMWLDPVYHMPDQKAMGTAFVERAINDGPGTAMSDIFKLSVTAALENANGSGAPIQKDMVLIRQPLGWAWLVSLGLAMGIGACWAFSGPHGGPLAGSFAAVFPQSNSAPRSHGRGAAVAIIAACVGGMLVLGWARDGSRVLSATLADQGLRAKVELLDYQEAEASRKEAERIRKEKAARESAARAEEILQADRERLRQSAEDAIKLKAQAAVADAQRKEREAAAAAEQQRQAAITAERERTDRAKREADAAALHQQQQAAWTTAFQALSVRPRTTRNELDQAIIEAKGLADVARAAEATPALEAFQAQLVSARSEMQAAQTGRATLIRSVFKERTFNLIPKARSALKDYRAAGGDVIALGSAATRLDSAQPWASAIGDDTSGAWADLDADSVSIRLRRIPGSRELWLAQNEMTVGDFALIHPGGKTGSDFESPVVGVSLADAKAVCGDLATRTALTVRLPTIAEWTQAQNHGDKALLTPSDQALTAQVWFADNAGDRVHVAGGKPSNRDGFQDLLGNAAEWVVGPDGAGLLIGGSWKSQAWDIGPAVPATPDTLSTAGLRVLLEP